MLNSMEYIDLLKEKYGSKWALRMTREEGDQLSDIMRKECDLHVTDRDYLNEQCN